MATFKTTQYLIQWSDPDRNVEGSVQTRNVPTEKQANAILRRIAKDNRLTLTKAVRREVTIHEESIV